MISLEKPSCVVAESYALWDGDGYSQHQPEQMAFLPRQQRVIFPFFCNSDKVQTSACSVRQVQNPRMTLRKIYKRIPEGVREA